MSRYLKNKIMKKILYLLFLLPLTLLSQKKENMKILEPSLIKELELMSEREWLYRGCILYDKVYLLSEKERNMLWQLQFAIDDSNTKRLIEIIKKHGYVDHRNSNIDYVPMLRFFLHAPKKYWEEIKVLIDKEKQRGNIDDTSYNAIISHMKFSIPEDLKINYLPQKENDSLNKQ